MKTTLKTVLSICLLVFLCQTLFSQSWEWTEKVGSSSADVSESVVVDHMGDIIIAGKFGGSATIGTTNISSNGLEDMFVAKYDSLGNNIWIKTAGGTIKDEGLAVTCDFTGNVYVTGHFKSQATFGTTQVTGGSIENFFVAKYSSTGNFQWVKTSSGPGKSIGKGMECDMNGNVLVTGYFQDTCVFGTNTIISPDFKNVFTVKYSPSGNLLWLANGGGDYDAWASSLSTDDYCNSYITGAFKDTAYFGSKTIISQGGNDVFLVKYDSSGNCTWAVRGGGNNNDYGNGMRVDPLNNIAVTGSFFDTVTFSPAAPIITNGSKDGFVVYYNPQGNALWARTMGGLQQDKGIDVDGDKDGNIYVTGFVNGIAQFNTIIDTGRGGDDVFIAKYDNLGNIIYADLAGGASSDYGKGIDISESGVAYITGDFRTTAYFSNDTLTVAGDRDAFLTKYYDGSPLFVSQPSDLDVCVGDTVTLSLQLTGPGPGPFSYLWFDDAGSILGAVNSTYTFIASDTTYSGKYYCMANNSIASVTSDTAFITVYPLPIVDLGNDTIIYMPLYMPFLILDAGQGFVSYNWSTGDTTQIITPQLNLGYNEIYVVITDVNGCQNSDTINILLTVGVEENSLNEFNCFIFPNPAKDLVTLKTSGAEINSIKLFNISGQLIKDFTLNKNDNEFQLLLNDIPDGFYFVRFDTNLGVQTRKLIVMAKD